MIFLRDFCIVSCWVIGVHENNQLLGYMFGQGAQAPLIEIQWFVQSAFSMANFLKKYFVRKNRQGGGELLNCYRKMVQ